MKTKFLIITDIHQYEKNVLELINKYKPDVVLDCGDHTTDKSFYTKKSIPWYFIYGNHENSEIISKLSNKEIKIKNLNLILPGEIVNINGINITGFGGNYSPKTFLGKNKKTTNPFHIRKEDFKKIKNLQNKKLVDILLMHESGKQLWSDTEYNFGQKIHDEVIALFPNVQKVISGHYHVPNKKGFKNLNNKKIRTEISLNTPENYSHILLESKNKKLNILQYSNK